VTPAASPLPRTVLIFAYGCAPYARPAATVGAQRPAQFAKHLPAFGWRAIVLCCDGERRGIPTDLHELGEDVRRRLRAADPGASLLVPTPSLPHDDWLDRAWRAAERRARARPGVWGLPRKLLTAAKFTRGDYSQAWQPCARRAAEVVAEETAVDVCIGEHSPDAGLFLARWFAARFAVPWIADFRDPILMGFSPLARVLYRPLARHLLTTASHTVNVTPVWAEQDAELFGRPATSIPNGFDPEEFVAAPQPAAHQGLRIVYAGNIIPAQRIEIFLEGLARLGESLPEAELRLLRFVYRGFQHAQVRQLAERLGIAGIVDAQAPIERERALALMQGADALLLLSIAEPEREPFFYRRGLYPAKAFEYLGARRPILCVPGDRGLLDAWLEETRAGVALPTPAEVAAQLGRMLSERRAGRALPYEPDAAAVARYTRRQLTGRLAALLEAVRSGAEAPAPLSSAAGTRC